MAITLTKDMNLDSYLSQAKEFKANVSAWKRTVANHAVQCSHSVSAIDFGDWEDDASTKMHNFVNNSLKNASRDLDPALSSISVALGTNIQNLVTKLEECKDAKDHRTFWADELDKTSETKLNPDYDPNADVSYYGSGWQKQSKYIPNPYYTTCKNNIKYYDGILDTKIEEANILIGAIDSYSFVPKSKQGEGSGGNNGGNNGGNSNGNNGGDSNGDNSGGNDGGAPAGDGPTVNKGDTVTVSDTEGNTKTMVYYGTTEDGVNLYVDPSGGRYMYVQYPDGSVHKTNGTETSMSNNGVNIGGGRIVDAGDLNWSMNINGSNPQCEVVGKGNTSRQNDNTGAAFEKPVPYSPNSSAPQSTPSSSQGFGGGAGGGGGTRGGGAGRGNSPAAENPAPVTVTVGDIVTVNGRAGTYLGTTKGGTNVYSDTETNRIFYQQSDGTVSDSNADYTHYYNYGANINGQVVNPGDTYSTRTYSDGNAGFTYVSSGGENPEDFDPYVEG